MLRDQARGKTELHFNATAFQRQAATFLERKEAEQENAELSSKRFAQCRESSRSFSGKWSQNQKKIIEDLDLKFHFQNLSFPDFTFLCLLSLFLRKEISPDYLFLFRTLIYKIKKCNSLVPNYLHLIFQSHFSQYLCNSI